MAALHEGRRDGRRKRKIKVRKGRLQGYASRPATGAAARPQATAGTCARGYQLQLPHACMPLAALWPTTQCTHRT